MRNSFFNSLVLSNAAQVISISLISVIAAVSLSSAEEAKPVAAEAKESQPGTTVPQPAELPPAEPVSPEIAALYEKYGGYCAAIVDDAREQRYASKRGEIETLAADLKKRIEVAEAQSAALEKWVNRREEFAKQATEKIVEIYANMRPEASALRLQQLDINLAASLLLAIPPRKASPILNEMDEKNAAAITAVMAASARMDDPS
jgi:flagellar motility protein MotE (MotC chaperone)